MTEKKKIEVSKNDQAELICGIRGAGIHAISINEPWEQGYECPICKTKVMKECENELELLEWSEYTGFLYCPICNIDIPSFYCLQKKHLDTKEKVAYWTTIYLDLISEYQKRILNEQWDLSKAQLQAQVQELQKEVQYYRNVYKIKEDPIFLKKIHEGK